MSNSLGTVRTGERVNVPRTEKVARGGADEAVIRGLGRARNARRTCALNEVLWRALK